ncbi:MAG: putative ABC transporter permease subunit [Candidatus Woesearchaeota archaeon]
MLLYLKYIIKQLRMINKLFRYYINKAKRYYQSNTNSRVFVTLAMSALLFVIAYTVFQLTREGLIQTQNEIDDFVMQAAPLFLYQVFLLVVGFLVFVSTSIFTLLNFFKGDSDNWIMASPRYNELCWINFVRAVSSSSWVIVVMAIPLIFAVQSVFQLSFLSFLLVFFAVILFAFFSSTAAIVLIFLFSFLTKFFKKQSFKFLSFCTSIACIFYGVLIWRRTVNVDFQELFQVYKTTEPVLDTMMNNFAIFPSYYPAMTIFYLQNEDFQNAFFSLLVMLLAVILLFILFMFIQKTFLNLWQNFQEGSFEAKSTNRENKRVFFLSNVPDSPEKVIFRKELLTGMRSFKNTQWLLFLMFLLVLQVGVVTLLSRYANSAEAIFAQLLPALQLGLLLYFISALILRFVFPSFSQEGNTSWLMGVAPLDFKQVFYSKYRFFVSMVVLIGVLTIILYAWSLGTDMIVSFSFLVVAVVAISTLTMLALSLGAIYANFETDDPHILSTSSPGIIFAMVSLLYSIFAAYTLYVFLSGSLFILPILFLVFSSLIYIFSSSHALRALEDMEYY